MDLQNKGRFSKITAIELKLLYCPSSQLLYLIHSELGALRGWLHSARHPSDILKKTIKQWKIILGSYIYEIGTAKMPGQFHVKI